MLSKLAPVTNRKQKESSAEKGSEEERKKLRERER